MGKVKKSRLPSVTVYGYCLADSLAGATGQFKRCAEAQGAEGRLGLHRPWVRAKISAQLRGPDGRAAGILAGWGGEAHGPAAVTDLPPEKRV